MKTIKLFLLLTLATIAFSKSWVNWDNAKDLISITSIFAPRFYLNVSFDGSKRENIINLFNGLNETIKYSGAHQNSGKISEYGKYVLQPKQNTTWTFAKQTASAAGSNGAIVWNLPKNKSLLIFYQNPLYSFNFAGICIIDQKPIRYEQQLQKLYDNYYSLYQKWPKQCVFGNNNLIKMVPYFQELQLKDQDFSIEFVIKYELIDNGQPYDCYTQKLNIVVRFK